MSLPSVTPTFRRTRLSAAIKAGKVAQRDPHSAVIDRHRTRARGTPKLAYRWSKEHHAHFATAWDNRFLPLPLWCGPYRSVYLARKALEGVVT